MGTLSTELAPHAQRLSSRPRIYADANVPAGLVAHMRLRLQWDVLFVIEEDNLRRAPDLKHYRLAQQLRRTLVTMDRDYLDDKRFPPGEGSGGPCSRIPMRLDSSATRYLELYSSSPNHSACGPAVARRHAMPWCDGTPRGGMRGRRTARSPMASTSPRRSGRPPTPVIT